MTGELQDSVVVITGASSGIGRAAALAFARHGATVVLGARREQALRDVELECQQLGGRALAVPTDVIDEDAVQTLARQAIENFGRIDIWVNNAAISLFGRFEEIPSDGYRRVIETNLFGYIYGARAALPYLREQGSGVIINNASIVSVIGQPYTSPYVLTKWAIRALGECLRMELSLDDAPNIHVCTVLLPSVDTPLFQHAANYMGRAVKPMSPVYDPEHVAQAIVELAQRPQRERFVGIVGKLLYWQHILTPGLTERLFARRVAQDHFQDRRAVPTTGNLFEPMPQWTSTHGGWKAGAAMPLARLALPALALAAGGIALWLGVRPARRTPAASRCAGSR